MDKTYAETCNEAPFDWNLALANPPEFLSDDHYYLQSLADAWTTCACGNQCAIIPRSFGAPDDKELNELGRRFMFFIEDAEWNKAKNILAQIESRASILISHELAKLSSFSSPI